MSDLNTRMPSGSDVIQRTDKQPAFSVDLLESILQTANIAAAWKRVRANKGAVYQPSPVRRVDIDKPDGGKRQLGIPTLVDRIVQQAIAQVLTPIFDPTFSENSFGFRPNRNGQQAVTVKSHVVKVSESKFPGFTFKAGRIQWHPKTLLKFKQQVRRLTNRNRGVSMRYQQRTLA